MANEPKAMKEIHKIRVEIREETKDMTLDERKARMQKIIENHETKYGKLRRAANDDVQKAM